MIARVTRGRLLAAVTVLALAAGVPLGLAAHSKGSVKVTLKEFKVTPKPTEADKGSVTFAVKNTGRLKHEFIVLKTAIPQGKLPVKGSTAVLKGKVEGKILPFAPGKTKVLKLTLPAGRYILLCNLPGHYGAGQHAAFKVS